MALLDIAAILGAGARGQQDYQKFLQDQQQAQQMAKMRDMQIREYQNKLSQQQQDIANTQGANALMMNFFKDRLAQVPPPPTAPQAPAPGQASVPMQQPGQQPTQQQVPQQDPSENLVNGLKQRAQMLQTIDDPNEKKSFVNSVFGNIAALPNPAQRDQLSKVWANVVQQDAQRVPPYRSMSGQQGGGAQQNQQPTQIPKMPKMSMEEIAQWAVKQGVTNPNQFATFLDKAQGFMNNEAKMEAAQWKQMYQSQLLSQAGKRLEQGGRRLDQGEEKISQAGRAIEQRQPLVESQTELNKARSEKARIDLAMQKDPNLKFDDKDLDFLARQYWAGDRTVFQNLGRGQQSAQNIVALRKKVREVGQEMDKTPQDLATATAEFEGLKAGERALGTRTAQAGMAGNAAANLAEQVLETSKSYKRMPWKSINEIQIAMDDKTQSPELRRFAGAVNSYVNAYARAINPSGASTVSDKEHAREILAKGFSDGDVQAAIGQLQKEIEAEKKAPGQTKQELRDLGKAGNSGGLPDGWSVKVK